MSSQYPKYGTGFISTCMDKETVAHAHSGFLLSYKEEFIAKYMYRNIDGLENHAKPNKPKSYRTQSVYKCRKKTVQMKKDRHRLLSLTYKI